MIVEEPLIPLPDGARLTARIWRPETSEPVPALLEYIPYRWRDCTVARDERIHPWFAGRGFASARVDIRGSGGSDGILLDEYLQSELEDGAAVVAWLAAQPWCSGRIGIFGKSWGGFNALQVAALQPPALGAVISVCGTDDRYADDVHYMGGCLLASDMLPWAAWMLAYNARPRYGSHELRLGSPPFVEEWLRHQRRDAFWQHGSVCEDYSKIQVPAWLVGGWHDPYRNAVFRYLEGATAPRWGLVGNWAHNYPHDGLPGPPAEWREMAGRWFDHWLRDGPELDWPSLMAWIDGRWLTPRSIELQKLELAGSGRVETDLWCGAEAGCWCPGAAGEDMPGPDDGIGLELEAAFEGEVLGFPEAILELDWDRPKALVAVRLCEGDRVIARGLANLFERSPGEVRVRLQATGHRFRGPLRLMVSPAYWPWAWPSPELVRLQVRAARLELPVLTVSDPVAVPAAPALTPAGGFRRRVERDGSRQVVTYDYAHFPRRLGYRELGRDTFTIDRFDPLSARVDCERRCDVDGVRVEARTSMWSDAEAFHVLTSLAGEERRVSLPRETV